MIFLPNLPVTGSAVCTEYAFWKERCAGFILQFGRSGSTTCGFGREYEENVTLLIEKMCKELPC